MIFHDHINPLTTDVVKNSIQKVLTDARLDYGKIHQSGLKELLTDRFGGIRG